VIFDKTESSIELESVGPKWRKNAPSSVVLFATDGRGTTMIVDHDGPDAHAVLAENRDAFLYELNSYWDQPGLWVWEGRVRVTRDYWGEYDEHYDGEVRPLTEDEARAVRENDLVWDPKLWREDG
jgi:hypothetical protein